MGLSPKKGEVQQLTIEVPGPVRKDQWDDYKADLEELIHKYSSKTTVKGKIVEIVYLGRKGKRVKPDGRKKTRRKRNRGGA